MYCPKCGAAISLKTKFCPKCGAVLVEKKTRANKSYICIKRISQYSNKLRKFDIYLDNKNIGSISDGEEVKSEIAPGKHEILLKIDWCSSNKLAFDIEGGQTINFNCGCSVYGWKILFVLIYILCSPGKYLFIEMS